MRVFGSVARRAKPEGPPPAAEWTRRLFLEGSPPSVGDRSHRDYTRARFFGHLTGLDLAALWKIHRDELLAEWMRKNPGTRPAAWWKYDTPELRQPLPGQGLVAAGGPWWSADPEGPPWTQGVSCLYQKADGATITGADPVFAGGAKIESQAAYLKRLGLFLPGEQKRLSRAAYRAEVVERR